MNPGTFESMKVTYKGPDSYYVARDGIDRITLRRDVETDVPDNVADTLAAVEGHDFTSGSSPDADQEPTAEPATEKPGSRKKGSLKTGAKPDDQGDATQSPQGSKA